MFEEKTGKICKDVLNMKGEIDTSKLLGELIYGFLRLIKLLAMIFFHSHVSVFKTMQKSAFSAVS